MDSPDAPPLTPLPCALGVPAAFEAPARYAVEELLRGLGRRPAWAEPAALPPGGLWYGDPAAAPAGAHALPFDPEAPAFFASGRRGEAAGVAWFEWDGERWPAPFARGPDGGELGGVDVVASAFFWLSGWQEVTDPRRDVHGRYPYRYSLQAALGVPLQPMVDAYRMRLGAWLRARGVPAEPVRWGGRGWACLITHDIDLMRKRRTGTLWRAAVARRPPVPVLRHVLGRDPYRAGLERLQAEEDRRGVCATYFFMAAARGRYDVAYGPRGRYVRRRIEALQAAGHAVGLHPSYFAHDHRGHLAAERVALGARLGTPPALVRQHFLRYDPLATPAVHEQAGFALDSSLGWSAQHGFRRGTAHPFRVWDPAAGRPTAVWELPLAGMDTSLFTHQALGPEAALGEVERVLRAAERVGGAAVLLWHNTAYDALDYPEQGGVFERVLDLALGGGAWTGSLPAALGAYGRG